VSYLGALDPMKYLLVKNHYEKKIAIIKIMAIFIDYNNFFLLNMCHGGATIRKTTTSAEYG
jgi:hypothetical protein